MSTELQKDYPQPVIKIYTDKCNYLKVGHWVVLNDNNTREDAMVKEINLADNSITILPRVMKFYTKTEIDNFPLRVKHNP